MESKQNNNLDDLLNDLKSKYNASNTSKLIQSSSNQIDNLLDKVKSELKTNKISVEANVNQIDSNKSQVDESLDSIKAQYKQEQNSQFSAEVKTNKVTQNKSQVNESLDSIKTQYKQKQNHQQAQGELIYNRNKQEIIIQEQQKQLQRKQLVQQAEKWLANLDPSSDEGMWFNQLAESYPSRLDAAINYLSTINNSSF
jgi:chromosome segregation ATPase